MACTRVKARPDKKNVADSIIWACLTTAAALPVGIGDGFAAALHPSRNNRVVQCAGPGQRLIRGYGIGL